jgi:hypothetical protein
MDEDVARRQRTGHLLRHRVGVAYADHPHTASLGLLHQLMGHRLSYLTISGFPANSALQSTS